MLVWEEDIDRLRASARTGTRVSLLLLAGVTAYFLLTLDRAHRTEMLVVDVLACLVVCTAWFVPLDALLRRRLVHAFFLAWSMALIGIVGLAVGVEGDPASPLITAFFLPIVFAALA